MLDCFYLDEFLNELNIHKNEIEKLHEALDNVSMLYVFASFTYLFNKLMFQLLLYFVLYFVFSTKLFYI